MGRSFTVESIYWFRSNRPRLLSDVAIAKCDKTGIGTNGVYIVWPSNEAHLVTQEIHQNPLSISTSTARVFCYLFSVRIPAVLFHLQLRATFIWCCGLNICNNNNNENISKFIVGSAFCYRWMWFKFHSIFPRFVVSLLLLFKLCWNAISKNRWIAIQT